jgi:phage baseplate assembly protein W
MADERTIFEAQRNFLGWPFRDFETTDDVVEITKFKIQFLFSVIQGERLGNIRYGNTLWKRIFNQLTDSERVAIQTEILRTLKTFMPDLVIKKVLVDDDSSGHSVLILIEFALPKYDNIEATFSMRV